jgi:hypothetical protein
MSTTVGEFSTHVTMAEHECALGRIAELEALLDRYAPEWRIIDGDRCVMVGCHVRGPHSHGGTMAATEQPT